MEQFNLEGKIAGYNKKTLAMVVAAIILLGIGFYAGAKYEKNKLANLGLLKNSGATTIVKKAKKVKTNVGTNNIQAGNTVSGSIVSKDVQGVTIKTSDNASQIVSITSATKIGATGTGTLADLTVGEQITASGTKNSDGSFSAENIQPVVATTNGQ